MPSDPCYLLAPGVEAIPMDSERLLFRSETLAVRVEGGIADVLAKRILPLLDGRRKFSELAKAMPDLPPEILRQRLDSLVQERVLRIREQVGEGSAARPGPLLAMFEELGVSASEAAARLASLHVTIFGLGGHGSHLAVLLAAHGIGGLRLVDSAPLDTSAVGLVAGADAAYFGESLQEIVRREVVAIGSPTAAETAGSITLARASVAALCADTTFVVGCFNRDFETGQHWVNRASLERGIPALYAQCGAHEAFVGPFVLPKETPCFMCYRMRAVACATNLEEAMAYEEFLNRRKSPEPSDRPLLPLLGPYVASVLAAEILKHFVADLPPTLAGAQLEFDALSLQSRLHRILRHPECPVCAKKKGARQQLSLEELIQPPPGRGDVLDARPLLVSARTGVVRRLERFAKDSSEPIWPFIFRADVANNRFTKEDAEDSNICSGKGITTEAAQQSALGEAVERYSSTCHGGEEVQFFSRQELGDKALDPRRLVLYFSDQYHGLPYSPYDDASVLGWVPARSLATDAEVLVPAISVFMNYRAAANEEFICPITSNGLATGPTLLDAVFAAALEVVERDAFLNTWLNRLPGPCFRPDTLPDAEMRELHEAYRRRAVELRLRQLPTDMPCFVFACIALDNSSTGPSAVVALGAAPDAASAARKALLEVTQVRPGLRQRLRQPKIRARLAELLADPREVKTLHDHDLLYASPESLAELGFLLDEPADFPWYAAQRVSPAELLSRLVDHLQASGSDLLYANLTPPDMEALHLYTARAILPGFQPIDFGWKERRLAGERLFTLGRTLGLRERDSTRGELNPAPHPLA